MYSPSGKYRFKGASTGIPYSGSRRLHMILGLFFGIVTCTWAFSGMLSMDPPFLTKRRPPGGGDRLAGRIVAALSPAAPDIQSYDAKPPEEALAEVGSATVKELTFTSFDGQPVYVVSLGPRERRKIVPVNGEGRTEYDSDRIFNF